MRVTVYVTGEWPASDIYRQLAPAEAVAAQGGDVVVKPLALEVRLRPDGTVDAVTAPEGVDVMVLRCPLKASMAQAIPLLQAAGVAVAVDVVDHYAAVHPDNITYPSVHPVSSPDENFHHLARACRVADLVTVSTPALAGVYGAHGRVRVIPFHIPASYLDIVGVEHDPPWVGWTGWTATHPGDLQVTRGAVARTVAATGAKFVQIGPHDDVAANLNLTRGFASTGPLDFDDYPAALAQLDVGIVPIADNLFNRCKSALKVCEMASVGVPAVVSPTPDNLRMAKLGVGLIAARPRDWERHLRRLIREPNERRELAERGRTVMAGHTIEANAWRWAEAWEDAYANHRARSPAID